MNKKFNFDKLEIKEIKLIANNLLLGATITGRGVLWFTAQSIVLNDSPFYMALHNVMPIWVWGLIVMITGGIFTSSAFHVTSMEVSLKYYWLSCFGGVSSSVFYFFMLVASLNNNLNWLTPFNFLILTVWTGVIGFVSGAEIYARRK
ncbi:hypothetical protein ACFP67_14290 [Mammaliicoccus sciuri]|uniref:hypothetical protein n=1 Tax=Mammaliicoccus sciuri TaxID=1296 RepID=UPI000CD1C539|nr:hypothetical protein [Mammaliicoccus sciuri]PNZ29966.1 hypothetical protein CD114_01035 [Mammaliicoccus sciuri]